MMLLTWVLCEIPRQLGTFALHSYLPVTCGNNALSSAIATFTVYSFPPSTHNANTGESTPSLRTRKKLYHSSFIPTPGREPEDCPMFPTQSWSNGIYADFLTWLLFPVIKYSVLFDMEHVRSWTIPASFHHTNPGAFCAQDQKKAKKLTKQTRARPSGWSCFR